VSARPSRWRAGCTLVAALGLLLAWVPGCEEPADPHTPAGALAVLLTAYEADQPQAVRPLLTSKTNAAVKEAYEGLRKLEGLIQEHLLLSDRERARDRSGVVLLKGVDSEEEFFARLVRLDTLELDSGVTYGAEATNVRVDPETKVARVTTRSGQTFEFEQGEEGVWLSRHLEAPLEQRLAVLRANIEKLEGHAAAIEARDKEVQALLGDAPPAPKDGAAGGERAADAKPGAGGEAPEARAPGSSSAKPRKRRRKRRRRKRSRPRVSPSAG